MPASTVPPETCAAEVPTPARARWRGALGSRDPWSSAVPVGRGRPAGAAGRRIRGSTSLDRCAAATSLLIEPVHEELSQGDAR